MQIRLSLIIPAYNCSAFMDETFGSVLDQLPGDCELIAVDDGSTERFEDHPEEKEENLPKIRNLLDHRSD